MCTAFKKWAILATVLCMAAIAACGKNSGNAEATANASISAAKSDKLVETRKAAEQGDAEAQFNLAMAYGKGEGVAKDPQQEVAWLQKAAEQGYARAQFHLGGAYASGNGVAQDMRLSAEWCHKAAEQGFAPAQFMLGLAYNMGKGVEKDMMESYKWFSLAAANNNKEAVKMRDAIEPQMTPEQVQQAKSLLKGWRPQTTKWERIGDSREHGVVIYFDPASIHKNGEIRQVVVLYNSGSSISDPSVGKGKNFLSMKSKIVVYCMENRMTINTEEAFAGAMAEGEVVHSESLKKEQRNIQPGTVSALIIKKTCAI